MYWAVFCCSDFHIAFLSCFPCGAARKKADWILPAGHGLDPDHEVLLRVRQRLNAAKRLKDYTWDQLLRWNRIRGNGNSTTRQKDWYLDSLWYISCIIHRNWHLTELLKPRNLLRTPALTNRLIMIHRPFPTRQSAICGLAIFGFRRILRLFVFCDHDQSGTLDWKEFKHLVRDTLSVPQEAVTLIAPVVHLCNVMWCMHVFGYMFFCKPTTLKEANILQVGIVEVRVLGGKQTHDASRDNTWVLLEVKSKWKDMCSKLK